MIYIVIDNAPVPSEVVGVFRSWELANEFVAGLPEDGEDTLSLTTWDIVNNLPAPAYPGAA